MLKILLAACGGVAALAAPLVAPSAPLLVWNASASAPIGLYRITRERSVRDGALVLARPPAELAHFLAARGYLPQSVPLIKRVAAVEGQTVCRRGAVVAIDGGPRAVARSRDRRGRPLPAWSGCRRLRAGAVFLLNPDAPFSLDGRYFGPIPCSSIIGHAAPVWTVGDRS